MKKMYKGMVLLLGAAMLICVSVIGTLAYLKMQTPTITNTMTLGKVEITLQEYGINADGSIDRTTVTQGVTDIKLVPGRKIEKNPFITVAANSEDCYLFVEIVNGLGADADIHMVENWTQIAGTNYWMYTRRVSAEDKVDVFDYFTCSSGMENNTTYDNITIAITACAVQAEGFDSAQAAWTASGFGANP